MRPIGPDTTLADVAELIEQLDLHAIAISYLGVTRAWVGGVRYADGRGPTLQNTTALAALIAVLDQARRGLRR